MLARYQQSAEVEWCTTTTAEKPRKNSESKRYSEYKYKARQLNEPDLSEI